MSTQVDLQPLIRGDTYSNLISMTDAAGAPITITGRKYWITLKLDPTTADAAAGNVQASVTATGSPAAHQAILSLTAAQTIGLVPGSYHYDIQETNAGVVTTICYGKVKVIRDVTVTIV
jgi:hypothetical protein